MTDYENYTSITFERLDGILRVRLDNPRNTVNAVDGQMHAELRRLFAELKVEDSARAIVFTSSGSTFSAGGDIEWFSQVETDEMETMARDGKQLIWNLLDVEIPIVAAINGSAIGIGATLALLCDVIFMADSATIADPHVRMGVTAGDGGTVAWPLAVGPAKAKEHLLTGDPITASDAGRLGLVNHVVGDAELQDAALAFAQRLAQGAPLAVRSTKVAVNQLLKQAAVATFDLALASEIRCFASTDREEAMRAFKDRRPPHFTGH